LGQRSAVLSPASACASPSPAVEEDDVERTGGAPHLSVLMVSPAVAAASSPFGFQVWSRRSPSAAAISPACPLMAVWHQAGAMSPARPCPALVAARVAVAHWAAMDLPPPQQRPCWQRHRRQRCQGCMYRACNWVSDRVSERQPERRPRVHGPRASSWAGWADLFPRQSRGPSPRRRR